MFLPRRESRNCGRLSFGLRVVAQITPQSNPLLPNNMLRLIENKTKLTRRCADEGKARISCEVYVLWHPFLVSQLSCFVCPVVLETHQAEKRRAVTQGRYQLRISRGPDFDESKGDHNKGPTASLWGRRESQVGYELGRPFLRGSRWHTGRTARTTARCTRTGERFCSRSVRCLARRSTRSCPCPRFLAQTLLFHQNVQTWDAYT